MIYYGHRIVPVQFVGGRLDGGLNTTDYAEHELKELLAAGGPWDFTPATIGSSQDEVIECYKLERRPGNPVAEWAYVHAGAFGFRRGPQHHRPVRRRPERWRDRHLPRHDPHPPGTRHQPLSGLPVHRDGEDPLSGWQMLPISEDGARQGSRLPQEPCR